MPYTVLLLEGAVKDIEAIYRYIRKSDNKKAAKDMVINIRKACDSLSENPERGHIPDELSQNRNENGVAAIPFQSEIRSLKSKLRHPPIPKHLNP
jgi:plasmid stabilization system protein ParE